MKVKQFIYVAAVFCLFALSVYFTKIFSKVFWGTFESGEKIINMDVSTYKMRYDNVWDKMKIYSKSGGEHKIEKININLTDQNQEELVKKINTQVKKINKTLSYKIPYITAEKIKSCTEYVNYGKCDANGFSFWYLVYDGEGKEVRMIVDTEFMTVYRISAVQNIEESHVIYTYGGGTAQVAVDLAMDWSDYNIFDNLFLNFYKINMNRTPDVVVNTDDKGIDIYAVYHDDFEDEDVNVAFRVRYKKDIDKTVFEWGMSYFDEIIQQ